MKSSLLRNFLFIASCLVVLQCANAQKKLLILGSSTSTCFFGPSTVDSCYITRLQRYYQGIGSPFILDNRAMAGDNVYQGMPLSFTPPSGRNSPRPYNNITDGLTGNPDVVLVNYPSNGYDIFTADEVMNCLRIIKQTANNAGKPCYITTTQPRNDPASYLTDAVRNKMADIKNRVISEFGSYAINFWDGIADPVNNSLLDMYQIDGIHINDAGHHIFFNRVVDRNIFNIPPPVSGGNGLTYKYYEGDWNSLPDFSSLQPVKSGSTPNIDMSPRNRTDYYAFLWEGSINIQTPGYYTFELVSDDGSKLYFNSSYSSTATALVNNDGLHPAISVSNSININSAGVYPIAISFFEKTGGEQIQVYWSGPGFSRQLIPNSAFSSQPGSGGNGLSFKYYEGDWNAVPDFTTLQPVKSGSTPNIDMSPRNRSDYYAFLWEGNINIPAAGMYTFELVSDDGSKLYFNSLFNPNVNPLVNNDGLHPPVSVSNSININAAGSYPIAIAFFEKTGGEQIQVYWSGPGFSRQLIPNQAFGGPSGSAGSGLNYKYFEGNWNTLPDFNTLQPVKTGLTPNIDMSPRNRADYYAFLWEGYIKITTAGTYTFETVSDDGSKLYFNSQYNVNANALVNNDGLHPPLSVSNSINISTPGTYPLAISFFEKTGGEQIQVYWSGPGFSRQLIPNDAFSSTGAFASNATNRIMQTAEKNTQNTGIEKTINAYPNPFNKSLDISFYNNSGNSDVSTGIFDLSGKRMHTQVFKNIPAGSSLLSINLNNYQEMASGIYFLKIDVNGIPFKVLKLVKSKN